MFKYCHHAMTAPMKEMAPIRLGNLEVARVEEMIWTVSPRFLCPGIRNAAFEPYRDWLVPDFSTTRYWWRISIHTFVVRTPHHTILAATSLRRPRCASPAAPVRVGLRSELLLDDVDLDGAAGLVGGDAERLGDVVERQAVADQPAGFHPA